jgi:hypothetical protein
MNNYQIDMDDEREDFKKWFHDEINKGTLFL